MLKCNESQVFNEIFFKDDDDAENEEKMLIWNSQKLNSKMGIAV